MIALLGSLLGFATSLAPSVFEFFQDKQDKKQELEILKLQIQQAEQGHTHKIEAIWAESDASRAKAVYAHDTSLKTESGFVNALRASVRPIITYLFFLLYASVKYAQLYIALQDSDWSFALISIWGEEDMGIWCAIISFWFGGRMMEKRRGVK